MKKPLTAIEIIKGAYPRLTHSNDNRIKVGKLTSKVAFEIVYQPTHTTFGVFSFPYAVSFATYEEGKFTGEYITRFKLSHEARSFIEGVKSALKYDAQTRDLFSHRYEQMGIFIDKGIIFPTSWNHFNDLYKSSQGIAFKILDPIYYVEFGQILNNLKGMVKLS